MHADPLRGHVVEEEEACAHGGEDGQEAGQLLPGEAAPDVVESAFDDGAAAVVGEETQASTVRS